MIFKEKKKQYIYKDAQFYLLLHHFEPYNVMTDSECAHALIN